MNNSAAMEQTQKTENESKVCNCMCHLQGGGRLERVQQVKALTAKPDSLSPIPEMVGRQNWVLQIVF